MPVRASGGAVALALLLAHSATGAAFVVELPAGALGRRAMRRYTDAVLAARR